MNKFVLAIAVVLVGANISTVAAEEDGSGWYPGAPNNDDWKVWVGMPIGGVDKNKGSDVAIVRYNIKTGETWYNKDGKFIRVAEPK